ncbi:MAG TPA: ATP-dependent protease ATPase subunit HslU [Vicinamibacterales bacterium]|nr:ATP-dependent protease ATPase subunit HslU [Vicinamibacterales bacterium]
MAISLPERTTTAVGSLTPREIVTELDKYVIGQAKAKRAVAIALRNRLRRQRLSADIADEVTPKNILMIGPTGVGKTEIARRLARLAHSPFIKVEASKFTEVGYVGRDVEGMVRDLVDAAVNLVRTEREDEIYPQAEAAADEKLLDLLLPAGPPTDGRTGGPTDEAKVEQEETRKRSREKLRAMLLEGKLDEREVEIEVTPQGYPPVDMMQPPQGMEGTDFNITEWLQNMLPKGKKRRTVRVQEARRLLVDEELKRMVDMDDTVNEALDRTENHGIIFVDEIDKIAGERATGGPDVSREGVQRDLLPIVEGSTVQTRYGYVRTDHILFIAAGAFHVSKPSDLIPELQGRFPIRVELTPLTEHDFVRIMTEPENALTKQYAALVGAEGCTLEFAPDAVREIARVASVANDRMENIGARRLQTVMATLMDEVLFELPGWPEKQIVFTAERVRERLAKVIGDDDLRRYIL